jgi:hypothetical protein
LSSIHEPTQEEINMARAKLEENRKRYMLEKQRGVLQFRMKPETNKKLKTYYDIYKEECMLRHFIVPSYHDFIIDMSEIGFLSWKEKNIAK